MDLKDVKPAITDFLNSVVKGWFTTAPTTPVDTPPSKMPPKDEVIKSLQHLLNKLVVPSPNLNEDGWLGPKTRKAIHDGIEQLHNMGIG